MTRGEGSDRFVFIDYDFSSSEDDKTNLSAIAEDSVFIGSSDFTGTRSEIRFDDGVLQISSFYEPDSAPTPIFEVQLIGLASLTVGVQCLARLSAVEQR